MITFALTETGELTSAKEAISGKNHFCFHCNCAMYRKVSRSNNPFFACKPGQTHTSKECRKTSENFITREPELTNSFIFHKHLLSPPNPSTGGGGGAPRNPPVQKEHSLPFQSLEDLWNSGLIKSNNIRIADGNLSDILLSTHIGYLAMDNNDSLGPRALEVTPDYYFEREQRIRFLFFGVIRNKADGSEQPYRKVIDLLVENREVFTQLTKKLFYTRDDSGVRQIKSKYKSVLIHGDWNSTPLPNCKSICRQDCNRKWKCSGHQHAPYVSSRQVYCPPSQKIAHK